MKTLTFYSIHDLLKYKNDNNIGFIDMRPNTGPRDIYRVIILNARCTLKLAVLGGHPKLFMAHRIYDYVELK